MAESHGLPTLDLGAERGGTSKMAPSWSALVGLSVASSWGVPVYSMVAGSKNEKRKLTDRAS